jgi:hypothetical protein
MRTAKRSGLPRYLRKPVVTRTAAGPVLRTEPVLIRTVAFVPAYLRKRLH